MHRVAISLPKTQHQVIAIWTAANEIINSNEEAALLTSAPPQQQLSQPGSPQLKPFQIWKVNTFSPQLKP